MRKIYKSDSGLAITIKYGVTTKHINFDTMTLGNSMYATDDEKEQEGIESHSWYGDKFALAEVEDPEEEAKKAAAIAKKVADKEAEEKELHTRQFSNVADAKEYVADTFGVSRTQLRSKDAVINVAKNHGVTIIISRD